MGSDRKQKVVGEGSASSVSPHAFSLSVSKPIIVVLGWFVKILR